ncbi:hypothetical protein DFA_09262 [Cavenderia fasciculata]|uniref:Uncharacterized protein n=1 Tax=Cavenderia fasciculata TaxID=261658 RepID=F4Q750_CACFS|nr:uncharacterized protein DFA_09262 [Cavenderia fasciculata]EGG16232.1 hypothetical protein DFA_09262 [Cavenderia fasciculata]|eukprot:XP_004354616.1 hypothetical protein DFA_09262 [Cavenderia fasciculata]
MAIMASMMRLDPRFCLRGGEHKILLLQHAEDTIGEMMSQSASFLTSNHFHCFSPINSSFLIGGSSGGGSDSRKHLKKDRSFSLK